MRVVLFRFDVDHSTGQPVYQPSAWVVASRSWRDLRGDAGTENFFEAFPKRALKLDRKGEVVMDPEGLNLATGLVPDREMRRWFDEIVAAGILNLPSVDEPPAEFYRRIRGAGKDEVPAVRVIRIQTEKKIHTAYLYPLRGDPRVEQFLNVEKVVFRFVTANSTATSVGYSEKR
jgi:hypothetical protein